MADESDTQELPTKSTAEEVRDDGHPDTTQPTGEDKTLQQLQALN